MRVTSIAQRAYQIADHYRQRGTMVVMGGINIYFAINWINSYRYRKMYRVVNQPAA
jgi:hypothetical protein